MKKISEKDKSKPTLWHPMYEEGLSIGARCLWSVVRQMECDNLTINTSSICAIMNIQRDTVRKYRIELVNSGWLSVDMQERNEQSRYIGTKFTTLPLFGPASTPNTTPSDGDVEEFGGVE